MFYQNAFTRLGTAFFACFLASTALAEPLATLDPVERIDEQMRPDSLISGNWLVGIHTSAQRAPDLPKLYSYVPGNWADEAVCVRVTGEQGRYTALYAYQMPANWKGGLAEFVYPTDHPDHVEQIDGSNSGVALHKGDCDTVSGTFVPVHWNALEQPDGADGGALELVLNVNAGRSDTVIGTATPKDAQEIPMECAPTKERGVGFNYQCTFTVPGTQGAELAISLQRFRFGRASPERTATIELFPALAQ